MKTNIAWKRAQQKEKSSWLETDMTYSDLMQGWKKRKRDFSIIFSKVKNSETIIDVGSGPVPVLHIFPKMKQMVAVDPLENMYRGKYRRLSHISYISAPAEKLPFANSSFNYALCINALDHVRNYKKVLDELSRCTKTGGLIFLEFENTSPIGIFLAKLGYKKPLYDFHPHLLRNNEIIDYLAMKNFSLYYHQVRPQFDFNRLRSIVSIIFGQRKMSTYEKNISTLNYGLLRSAFHYFLTFFERLLFYLSPLNFGYFTILIFKKN